jgi:hypothetical protein
MAAPGLATRGVWVDGSAELGGGSSRRAGAAGAGASAGAGADTPRLVFRLPGDAAYVVSGEAPPPATARAAAAATPRADGTPPRAGHEAGAGVGAGAGEHTGDPGPGLPVVHAGVRGLRQLRESRGARLSDDLGGDG